MVVAAGNERTLAEALEHAALARARLDGFHDAVFVRAGADLGLSAAAVRAMAMGSGVDLAERFLRSFEVVAGVEAQERAAPGITARVSAASQAWFEALRGDNAGSRRAFAAMATPFTAARGARVLWRVADVIWRANTPEDFTLSRWSKRGLLASALGATLPVALDDASDTAWRGVLDRRLHGAMRAGRAAGQALATPGRLARDLVAWLGARRYGADDAASSTSDER